MTLLSRKADYALLILWHLHQHSGGNARTIAEKFGLSRPFVANILKELNHKGYVTSHRGVKGGYALQRLANTITLAELLESIEEGFKLTVCSTHGQVNGDDDCSVRHICPVKGPMSEIHRRLMEVLRGVTLEELFGVRVAAASPTSPTTNPTQAAATLLPLLMLRETSATASA